MYCIHCGVRLADTEKTCPLCNTTVYHPELPKASARPLYPDTKVPKSSSGRGFLCGAVIIFFMIPMLVTLIADLHFNGHLDWFGYVAGALTILYLVFAFPMWFGKPHPVILVPCDFAAVALYLGYICLATGGDWFWSFALPTVVGLALIVCTLVTLLCYLRRGKLYVVGGAVMALGAWVLMIERLMGVTFGMAYIGWSLYPLVALALLGGLMIYLAINRGVREAIERKIFF